MTCSRTWEARALDEGRLGAVDRASFERHAQLCVLCRDELAALEKLRALTRELAAPEPSELELRRLRARVLRDAMTASTRPPSSVNGAFGLAAAVVVALAVALPHWFRRDAKVEEAYGAAVVAPRTALWTQHRDGHVERVVLRDGDISLHVRKQSPEERFLVVVPDGEVEVRGTTFEVSVHDGKTARVHVDTGVVVVRVRGESVLSAGETWPAQAPPRSDSSATAVPTAVPTEPDVARTPLSPVAALLPPTLPARIVRSSGVAKGEPRTTRVTEVHDDSAAPGGELEQYNRAIDTYRLGRFDEAAVLLRSFVTAYPSSALLDDATFIEASSAASAGRADQAAQLASQHMARFPQSFHRKDAAILVARARRGRGDCAGVREVLGPWLGESPRDAIVSAALGGCPERP